MKLAQKSPKDIPAHYMVRRYGDIQSQRVMHAAVKRLEEAMNKWK